jgi:hypothetical protein
MNNSPESKPRNVQASQKSADNTPPMDGDSQSPPSPDFPDWVWRKLKNPPPCGSGFHRWIFHMCCLLKEGNWTKDDIFEILCPEVQRRGRPERELLDAIEHAPGPREKSSQRTTGIRWSKADMRAIRFIGLAGWTLEELVAHSPSSSPRRTEVFDALFPDGCLVCAGDLYGANTLPKEEWFGQLRWQEHIVPSPMRMKGGWTKDGKRSQRCADNTGPRHYIVLDFDFKAKKGNGNPTPEGPILDELQREGRSVKDLCASLIAFIRGSTSYPLVLVVYSGGKSLHAWFLVKDQPEEEVLEFFKMCVRYGADRSMWTPCQWARMPGGTRDNGKAQTIHYFDPQALLK